MIPFPKMHIAESVVNRILNVHDELSAKQRTPQAPAGVSSEPVVADPTLQGVALDRALEQPAAPVAPDANVVANEATGKGALRALVAPGT